jgi:hypothetical protein
MNLCLCGCGKEVLKETHKYLHGHNWKNKKRPEESLKRIGKRSSNWNGGTYKDIHGYIYIYKPNYENSNKDGYILEHRYVMEKFIGKSLSKYEIVHHINEIRDDNRIENLRILNRSSHSILHLKGKKLPEDIKIKMRKPKSIIHSGKDSPSYGKKHSEESKIKMKISQRNRRNKELETLNER